MRCKQNWMAHAAFWHSRWHNADTRLFAGISESGIKLLCLVHLIELNLYRHSGTIDVVGVRRHTMKMVDDKAKKRPRDILASLDAAFAATTAKPASKYTSQAAQQTNAATAQQAYQHNKHKKKKQTQQQQQQQSSTAANAAQRGNQSQPQPQKSTETAKDPYDPLYGRLDVETLQVGLKNCSLHARTPTLRKTTALHATLKDYLSNLTKDGNGNTASDKLKNKVLQFDNPIRTTDASKRAAGDVQAQTAKLMGARQRRKLGMHLISGGISYEQALQLSEIWKRYARDMIGNDFVGDKNDEAIRCARLQSKLRNIDLSGCPIEVVRSRNPHVVGTVGIVVADKANVIQVCTAKAGKIITLPKNEIRCTVTLDEQRQFFVDGAWLLARRTSNE